MTAAFPTANVFRSFAVSVLILGTAALFSACASPGDNPSDTFSAAPFEVLDFPSGESWISINGEGSRMLFGRQGEDLGDYVIFESVRSGRTWGEPVRTSFSGSGSDRGARFYPALDAVVFSSNRAVAPGDSTADFDLWITQFDGEEWSSPEPMSPLNTDANEMHPSVAADGTIWFSSDRDGSFGQSDLWYAELGSTGYEVRQAPEPLNSEFAETDAFIDPAGRYIIFSRTEDPAGVGGDDLFLSLRSGATWSAPVNLGAAVNTPDDEYGPFVSRNGRTLFFTSHRSGTPDIYRIAVDELTVSIPQNVPEPSGIDVTTIPAGDESSD